MHIKDTRGRFLPEVALRELIQFTAFTNAFRRIERTILISQDLGKERDGEHSHQIALIAWYLNGRHGLGMCADSLIAYALVHDLVEIYAKDTPMFFDPDMPLNNQPSPADKDEREWKALLRIENEWGDAFPELVEYLHAYVAQNDEESRFIKGLEKMVATINIYLDGGSSWRWLKCTPDEYFAIKRAAIQKADGHPIIAELYEELIDLLQQFPELFHKQPETTAAQ